MSSPTVRIGFVKRAKEPPEDSVRLRVVVAAMVMVALVAVLAQGTTDAFTWVGGLLLVPAGYAFSYVQRHKSSVATKVVLVVGLVVALASFLQGVRGATTVDEARIPLASLFVWVQVLHSFDVPRRRDLAFSMVSSLILMAQAGALSFGTGFLVFLVPWGVLAAAWLYLSLHPASREVNEPSFVRKVAGRGGGVGPAVGRSLVAATVVVVTATAVVFAFMPRLPGTSVRLPPFAAGRALAVPGFDGQVANPGLPAQGGEVVNFAPSAYPGFGSRVDLRARGRLSDRVVMRVRSPQAALWRGQVYDTFDGTAWTASDSAAVAIGQSDGQSFLISTGVTAVPTRRLVTTFYVESKEPNIVFAAYAPQQVFFPSTQLSVDQYQSIRAPIFLDQGLVYSVISEIPITQPELLRQLPVGYGGADLSDYTQLPDDLPKRVVGLARGITAGATTTYDKVAAVQDWLRRNTRYNLDIPHDPPGANAIDYFLFESREGFCEHIATAMAVLLRAAGVPTRLVTGFGPGERNTFTGYFEVRESDAHAWVEVLYPEVGWVQYDPTFGVPPAAPGLGGRFIAPEVLRAVGRFVSRMVPELVKAAAREVGAALGAAAHAALSAWPVAAGLAVLLLLGLIAVRRLRAARRRPRPPTGAAGAFLTLSETLRARGHPRGEHQTPAEFLRAIRRSRTLPSELLPDAEVVVRTFERARFSGEQPSPEDVEEALSAAARVHEGATRASPTDWG